MNESLFISVGRSKKADITLPKLAQSATLSRVHASFCRLDATHFCLRDLASLNGTFVQSNGTWQQIDEQTICIGDVIKLGDYIMAMAELVALSPSAAASELRRNPETGAIERFNIS